MELLRSVVEELAVVPRLPTSDGEKQAAQAIRARLECLRCRVLIDEVPAFSSYSWPIGLLSAMGVVSALVSGWGHRGLGTIGGALATLGIIDDITGFGMTARRLSMRYRTAYNVVAEVGDPNERRTLVVLAHHDAAPSGLVFHQAAQEWLATHRPDIIAAMRSNPPMWWPVIAGPALVSVGSALRSRWLRWIGLVLALGSFAAMVDIGSRSAVPGANDNLSGVAAVVGFVDALRKRPLSGVKVILVSTGAEEALQEGIRGFAARYFPRLPRSATWFLNLDAVGSGRLVLLEGEGPVRMHYYDQAFKDIVANCAEPEGIPLIRGLSARISTDGIVPSTRGYPTATIVSVDSRKLIPHYHLYSDLPKNVDYNCVAMATDLVEAVARKLATRPDRAPAKSRELG